MVDLFKKNEEEEDFVEATNTTIPGGKVVNIAYLLILRTGGMGKSCEQWEDVKVGLQTCQGFKDRFLLAYRHYQIYKKAPAAAHGYGDSEHNS